MTVTGLLTGEDLLHKLSGKVLGDAILLPTVMLKHGETCFLDDLTVEEVEEKLGVPIFLVEDIDALLDRAFLWAKN
jgi:NifB/MoaA-like Fe-S oxidoreductase